ncbi:MAG: cytochrome c biogenesis protein ResB, partial [Candidatus Delongbacteria bacterium]|nr:cytochrome c biogenesis protein ResB [Candidatus Delongbacteria bacterium]
MLNFIKVIYRFVSSLGFGIFMLTLMAVVLALATGYEAGAGAQAVQMKVYQSRWFDLLIWLFIASLTLATWRLRPYRLHHLGVIVTHFSILLIAFGALVTRHVGYEGRLRLVEGETSDRLPAEGFALSLSRGGELLESIPVRLGNGQGDLQLREEIQFSDGGTVQLHQYLAAAAVRDTVRAAENGTSAYKLRLSGSDFDLNHWLLTGDERLARLTFGNNLQLQALPPQSTTQWQEAVEQWSETMTGASLTLDFPELGLHQTLNLAGSDTVFDITGSSLQLVIIQ